MYSVILLLASVFLTVSSSLRIWHLSSHIILLCLSHGVYMFCFLSVCTGTERAPEPLEAGPEVRPWAYVPVCHLSALRHLLWETLDHTIRVLLRCRRDLVIDKHILAPVTALLVAVISAMVWTVTLLWYVKNSRVLHTALSQSPARQCCQTQGDCTAYCTSETFLLNIQSFFKRTKISFNYKMWWIYKAVLKVYSTRNTSSNLTFCIFLFWNLVITVKHGAKKNIWQLDTDNWNTDIGKVLLLKKRFLLTLVTEIHSIYCINLPYLFLMFCKKCAIFLF